MHRPLELLGHGCHQHVNDLAAVSLGSSSASQTPQTEQDPEGRRHHCLAGEADTLRHERERILAARALQEPHEALHVLPEPRDEELLPPRSTARAVICCLDSRQHRGIVCLEAQLHPLAVRAPGAQVGFPRGMKLRRDEVEGGKGPASAASLRHLLSPMRGKRYSVVLPGRDFSRQVPRTSSASSRSISAGCRRSLK